MWAFIIQHTSSNILPTQETIAKELNISTSLVITHLKELLNNDLIIAYKRDAENSENTSYFSNSFGAECCHDGNIWLSNSLPPLRKVLLLLHKSLVVLYMSEPLRGRIQTECGAITRITKREKLEKIKQHPRWKRMASTLHKTVYEVWNINYTNAISGWAHCFRLLHTENKVAVSRIWKVLRWYCKELPQKDKWLPIARAGSTFRTKFSRIEDYMNRHSPEEEEQDIPKALRLDASILQEHMAVRGHTVDIRELAGLLRAVKDWVTEGMSLYREGIKEGEWRAACERKEKGSAKRVSLTKDGLNRIFRPGGVAFLTVYIEWILNEVTSWKQWAGRTGDFYPGQKHFKRFLSYTTQDWPLTRQERRIVRAT